MNLTAFNWRLDIGLIVYLIGEVFKYWKWKVKLKQEQK